MSSRKPPSQRDPNYAIQRQGRSLESMAPGTLGGRVANASPKFKTSKLSSAASSVAGGSSVRGYDIIFAASDSLNSDQEGADIVCPSGNTRAVIKAAYDALPNSSVSLLFLPGTYEISDGSAIIFNKTETYITGPGATFRCSTAGFDLRNKTTVEYLDFFAFFRPAAPTAKCNPIVTTNSNTHLLKGLSIRGDQFGALNIGITGSGEVSNCYIYGAYNDGVLSNGPLLVTDCNIRCAFGITSFYNYFRAYNNTLIFLDAGAGIASGISAEGFPDPLVGVEVVNNFVSGHNIGIDIGYTVSGFVEKNIVTRSASEGIYVEDAPIRVDGNVVTGSGQQLNDQYANIRVRQFNSGVDTRTSVTNNICRKYPSDIATVAAPYAKYGVLVDSGVVNAIVTGNDLRNGGQTAAFQDNGTTTYKPAGTNRVA